MHVENGDFASAFYTLTVRKEMGADNGDNEDDEDGIEIEYPQLDSAWTIFAVAMMSNPSGIEIHSSARNSERGELEVHMYRERVFPRNRIVLESGEMELFMLLAHTNRHELPIKYIQDNIIVIKPGIDQAKQEYFDQRRSSNFESMPLQEGEIDFMVSIINSAFKQEGLFYDVIIKKNKGDQAFYFLNPKLRLEHTISTRSKRVHDKPYNSDRVNLLLGEPDRRVPQ